MLDLDYVRLHPEEVARAAQQKGVAFSVEEALGLADRVRTLQGAVDEGNRLRKVYSKEFAKADEATRAELREKTSENAAGLKRNQDELLEARTGLRAAMLRSPQIPWSGTPVGTGEDGNVVIDTWGTPRDFGDDKPLDHVAILENRGWVNFADAREVSGERAYVLQGEGVLLERALISFGIDVMLERRFQLLSVPSLVREEALVGTGFLPGHEDEIYALPADKTYLAGTAEVALVGLAGARIHDTKDLPLTYAGISPCFRREIGSAGRDVRGLIRVHQFEKVEQFVVCEADPEVSAQWHQKLLETAVHILRSLELPHEVVECCTGDMGLGKYRMNDINTWFPSLGTYRETHSCSTLHDWQARRAGIRYRDAEGKVRFAHTLNNTAVATPRLLAAFVENAQEPDGRVRIPEALRPYLRGRDFM